MIIYNCQLCVVTMLQPIHMHFHLVIDHGVEKNMLRNFYQVVDRTDDSFDRRKYEENRYRRRFDEGVPRLWFLCYMCGTIMGQEIDLKAHLVGRHGAKAPIHTLVVSDHMVFREYDNLSSGGMDLGGAIADSTKDRMLKPKAGPKNSWYSKVVAMHTDVAQHATKP